MPIKFVSLQSFLLQSALAYVFAFAAVEVFIFPERMAQYIPSFVNMIMNLNIFHLIFGCFELILAAWFLSGRKLLYASVIAILLLVGIIIFNLDKMSVLFRNVGLIYTAAALAVINWDKKKAKK